MGFDLLAHPALLPFYGLEKDEVATERAFRLYEEASPIEHATKGDPAVFLFYTSPSEPLPEDATVQTAVHHPVFGVVLKQRLDELGVGCELRFRQPAPPRGKRRVGMFKHMTDFFVRQFASAKAEPAPRPVEAP